MQFEILAYIATFIISAGLAVIGILISYQLYQVNKKTIFQILLYQQIFLFSFFVYGIWGNMTIRELIADFNLSVELNAKLALFIPMIGAPFLVVSWFMFIRLGFILNERMISKLFTYIFFPILMAMPIIVTLLIHFDKIRTPQNPDLFVIRILLTLNIIVHFIFFIPFLFRRKSQQKTGNIGIENYNLYFYFLGVILYSILLNFLQKFEYQFIIICITIVVLFGVNILIPVFLNISMKKSPSIDKRGNIDFNAFCEFYEISRRESEIVLEICTGKSNKAISEKLFITLQTVKDHTHRIYTKTGVKSRVQLANLVREKTGE